MRKKIIAVVLSCLTLLTLVFSAAGRSIQASAVSVDEMTQTAVEIITKNEGTYGSVNCNDNGAVSVGLLQWHANRALQLMRSIANADPSAAQNILGNSFYNEVISASSWTSRTFSASEGTAAANLLTTSAGVSTQDALAYSDVQGYINAGKSYGITNAGVLVYYAELYNRGSGIAARILASASAGGSYAAVTLTELHNAALADSSNSSGYYTSRLNTAYQTILSLGWDDTSVSQTENSVQETESSSSSGTEEIDDSDFSESYAGSYTVTASSLNIRSAPTTDASVIGTIPDGETVVVSSGNGSWAAVSYGGIDGYCSMEYLAAAAVTTAAEETTAETETETKTETETETTTTTTETAPTETTTTETTTVTETTAAQTEASTETTAAAAVTVQSSAEVVGVSDPNYASIYGDINLDGIVDAADVVLLQKYLNGCVYLNFTQLANADCQRDDVLDLVDVNVIIQYLVHTEQILLPIV